MAGCENAQPPADLAFINGGIYTVDAERSWAEAAAIRGNRFVAVGSNREIEALIGPLTRVVDLRGRMAMPGIHDSHIHPLEGGYQFVLCDLFDTGSVEEMIETLSNCETDANGWLRGVGMDLALFGINGPDNRILDAVGFDGNIFIDASDGHTILVNDAVLALAGIDATTPDPADGVIERRDGTRIPTGTLRESARDPVDDVYPDREVHTSLDVMRNTLTLFASHGITSVVDLWGGEHEYRVYSALDDADELTIRAQVALIDDGVFAHHEGDEFERVLASRGDYASPLIDTDAIKIMVDGVFEGETGSVLEPYANVGHLGVLNHTPEELRERVSRYLNLGLQIHFHAMGDGAARAALDALAYARENAEPHRLQNRHSLSHLGLIHPDDLPRFAEVNAAASYTLVWGYTDEWTTQLEIPTLGLDRVEKLYPIKSTRDAGAVVVGGSDWNYGDLDPLMSIETGVTRDNPYEDSDYAVYADETVDLATMIDTYTINGAWLAQRDHELGSIENGKLADVAVYDRNLFEIPAKSISEANVDLTVFDGRIIYEREDAQ